jgi:glycosyltransferase involved in cell wall biosynthesis
MSVYAFTSVSLNYLPKARVLAKTLKRQHPEFKFVLLLAEDCPKELSAESAPFDEVIVPDNLRIPRLKSWLFKHTLVEVCTAMKGILLPDLLARSDCEAVFYLDPDIVVLGSMRGLLDEFAQSSILLTPHLLDPETSKCGIEDNELCALRHGVYNLGFLGVRPSSEGLRFASWWRDRLEHYCFDDIPLGLFTDQRWIDLAVGYFPEIAIIRDKTCNVATWNLSQRQVGGDPRNGLTIEGRPITFFHFSGIDSGAHLVSFGRYGTNMPGLDQLRDWYIAECQANDPEGFCVRHWPYDFYDNGRKIEKRERQLYRSRADLENHFSNPFASGGYSEWVRRFFEFGEPTRPGQLPVADHKVSLLERLMSEPGLFPLETCPWFSGEYYLATNPEVAQAGVNPLWHYAVFGHLEGRNPHPKFDTAFYVEQYPECRSGWANPLVHFMLVGQKKGYRTDSTFDEKRDRPRVEAFRAALDPKLPNLLMVGHSLCGGTERHILDLAGVIADRCNVLLLYSIRGGKIKLTLIKSTPEGMALAPRLALTFGPEDQTPVLAKVIEALRVMRVHIHHAMGNEPWLQRLIDLLALPYDVTLHDYYMLSPSAHLCDQDGRYVGEPSPENESRLLKSAAVSSRSLRDWQANYRSLLAGASRVIAPSQDLARRMSRAFPECRMMVVPHSEPGERFPEVVPPRKLNGKEPLRVAILGWVQPHKGLAVVQRCSQLAMDKDLPLVFHVVGDTLPKIPTYPESNLSCTGEYKPRDLPSLLDKVMPDLVWFPTQCPESYCYTLSEAMRAGCPIVAGDLGAIAERLHHRPWTWLVPWDLTPEKWLEVLIRIRTESFLEGHPPSPSKPGSSGEQFPCATSSFYTSEYLAWPPSSSYPR